VKYRTDGERRWHDGLTVNLSAAGAVIVGDTPASVAGGILVMIPLPEAAGCLIGRGRIVRSASIPARPDRCSFAIAVPHYRLEHQAAALTASTPCSRGASASGDLRVIPPPRRPQYLRGTGRKPRVSSH
jgi:hypothetical protein